MDLSNSAPGIKTTDEVPKTSKTEGMFRSEEKPAAVMEATTLSSFGKAACCHQGLAR